MATGYHYDLSGGDLAGVSRHIPSTRSRSALAKCGLTTKHIESQVRVLERRGAGEGKVM